MTEPTFAHGKICYIQMPALDIQASADFYRQVFDWRIRERGDGEVAFDDSVGGVSGVWDSSRKAADDPGMTVSIMVRDALATADAITAAGGEIIDAPDPLQSEVHGTFRDPAGNLLSIYEQKGMA
jgi:predicted enzyme related to lactoylglutathione lyase